MPGLLSVGSPARPPCRAFFFNSSASSHAVKPKRSGGGAAGGKLAGFGENCRGRRENLRKITKARKLCLRALKVGLGDPVDPRGRCEGETNLQDCRSWAPS